MLIKLQSAILQDLRWLGNMRLCSLRQEAARVVFDVKNRYVLLEMVICYTEIKGLIHLA